MLAILTATANGQSYSETWESNTKVIPPSQELSPPPAIPDFRTILPREHRELLNQQSGFTRQKPVQRQNKFGGSWPQGSNVRSPLEALGNLRKEKKTAAPRYQRPNTLIGQNQDNWPPAPNNRYSLEQPAMTYGTRSQSTRDQLSSRQPAGNFTPAKFGSSNLQPSPGPNVTQPATGPGPIPSGPIPSANNVWNSESVVGSPAPPTPTESKPLTAEQDRIRKMMEKVIVDPEKKYPVDPGRYPLQPDYPTPLQNNSQSNISPRHWGQNSFEPQNNYQAWPQDPEIYDREKDPNKPRKSLRQIFYEGRKFVSYDLLYLEPRYKANSALSILSGTTTTSVSSDFSLEFSSRIGFGFESASGPGTEFFYSEYDQTSQISATSSFGTDVCTEVILSPATNSLCLQSFAADQTLTVSQSTDLQYFDAMLFKFLKFKVAAIVGHIGVRYAEIDHEHRASLVDAGGTVLGQLVNESDFKGFGPRLGITYIRPIGHTRLRLIGHMSGAILGGDRRQQADVTGGPLFTDGPSEQILSSLEMRLGIEWAYNVSDSTSFYSRFGYESQSWFNGGTPIDPNSSFGLRGFVFGLGLNR
jgi:hypothetical protein